MTTFLTTATSVFGLKEITTLQGTAFAQDADFCWKLPVTFQVFEKRCLLKNVGISQNVCRLLPITILYIFFLLLEERYRLRNLLHGPVGERCPRRKKEIQHTNQQKKHWATGTNAKAVIAIKVKSGTTWTTPEIHPHFLSTAQMQNSKRQRKMKRERERNYKAKRYREGLQKTKQNFHQTEEDIPRARTPTRRHMDLPKRKTSRESKSFQDWTESGGKSPPPSPAHTHTP